MVTTTGGHSCFPCLHVQLYKVFIRGFVLPWYLFDLGQSCLCFFNCKRRAEVQGFLGPAWQFWTTAWNMIFNILRYIVV